MSDEGGIKSRRKEKMNACKNTRAMVLVHPGRAKALFGDALEAEQKIHLAET